MQYKQQQLGGRFWYSVTLAIALIVGACAWLASLSLVESVLLGAIIAMLVSTAYVIGHNNRA